jgi:hypothetical protein
MVRASNLCSTGDWTNGNQLLEICTVLLTHHPSKIIFQPLTRLLVFCSRHHSDIEVRDRAFFYYQLLTHVDSNSIRTIIGSASTDAESAVSHATADSAVANEPNADNDNADNEPDNTDDDNKNSNKPDNDGDGDDDDDDDADGDEDGDSTSIDQSLPEATRDDLTDVDLSSLPSEQIRDIAPFLSLTPMNPTISSTTLFPMRAKSTHDYQSPSTTSGATQAEQPPDLEPQAKEHQPEPATSNQPPPPPTVVPTAAAATTTAANQRTTAAASESADIEAGITKYFAMLKSNTFQPTVQVSFLLTFLAAGSRNTTDATLSRTTTPPPPLPPPDLLLALSLQLANCSTLAPMSLFRVPLLARLASDHAADVADARPANEPPPYPLAVTISFAFQPLAPLPVSIPVRATFNDEAGAQYQTQIAPIQLRLIDLFLPVPVEPLSANSDCASVLQIRQRLFEYIWQLTSDIKYVQWHQRLCDWTGWLMVNGEWFGCAENVIPQQPVSKYCTQQANKFCTTSARLWHRL